MALPQISESALELMQRKIVRTIQTTFKSDQIFIPGDIPETKDTFIRRCSTAMLNAHSTQELRDAVQNVVDRVYEAHPRMESDLRSGLENLLNRAERIISNTESQEGFEAHSEIRRAAGSDIEPESNVHYLGARK